MEKLRALSYSVIRYQTVRLLLETLTMKLVFPYP